MAAQQARVHRGGAQLEEEVLARLRRCLVRRRGRRALLRTGRPPQHLLGGGGGLQYLALSAVVGPAARRAALDAAAQLLDRGRVRARRPAVPAGPLPLGALLDPRRRGARPGLRLGPREDGAVARALRGGHGQRELLLELGLQLLEHVRLDPAEHEGREQLARALRLRVRDVDVGLAAGARALAHRLGQQGREDLRQHEGEQREELGQVVLHRRARQEQPLPRLEATQLLRPPRALPLERVRLVEHEHVVLALAQPRAVGALRLVVALEVGVARDEHVEALRVERQAHRLALRRRAVILDCPQAGAPARQLSRPIVEHG